MELWGAPESPRYSPSGPVSRAVDAPGSPKYSPVVDDDDDDELTEPPELEEPAEDHPSSSFDEEANMGEAVADMFDDEGPQVRPLPEEKEQPEPQTRALPEEAERDEEEEALPLYKQIRHAHDGFLYFRRLVEEELKSDEQPNADGLRALLQSEASWANKLFALELKSQGQVRQDGQTNPYSTFLLIN